ncbi:MAG: fatty acid oxidation complex subunit alpha FadJ [Anaerolineales bacterium]|nr:fatty acid oxidation complex subunit alpha FadJ [Anaerolineales bacterium]
MVLRLETETEQDQNEFLRLERRGHTAVLWLDMPGESLNTLKAGFDQPFNQVLDQLAADEAVTAVIIASAKADNFVVGADVKMLQQAETAVAVAGLARTAQAVMDRIAGFPKPIVAAIHGDCLGGGLELALACHGRVAASRSHTRLGQPEVNLGLIPGAGGTQRLPRLVGLENALDLILTGKRLPPEPARRRGLVDEVVHPAVLIEAAAARAQTLAAEKSPPPLPQQLRQVVSEALDPKQIRSLLLEENPAGRRLVFKQAHDKTLAETHGNYPAPLRAIEVIRIGIEEGIEAGLEAEAKAFGELAMTPQAQRLMELFFARSAVQKAVWTAPDVTLMPIRKAAVVGAGLMGSGISNVTAAQADLVVRLKDIDDAAIRDGLRRIHRHLDKRRQRHRITEREMKEIMNRIRPSTTYTGFGRADIVIEAVLEDLALKRQVLADVAAHAPENFIFASNTSSLPIHQLAEGSPRPENVVGMHYFSPVEQTPLLEVVAGEQTAPEVVATCVDLGRRQGKTVIVVNDGPGFYTTRILAPYLNEAAHLLSEGVPIERIDAALVDFGFPVGPLKLLDEVGIDVAAKISRVLEDALGERMQPPAALADLTAVHRYGRKNGRGFYAYEEKNGRFQSTNDVDSHIYRLLDIEPDASPRQKTIVMRCLLPLLNEAARCYADGVLRTPRDGDVGAVFGLGFPPFLGGPFRYMDHKGLQEIVRLLDEHSEQYGRRFAPAPILQKMAREKKSFYP